jgi:hypothetical protein
MLGRWWQALCCWLHVHAPEPDDLGFGVLRCPACKKEYFDEYEGIL